MDRQEKIDYIKSLLAGLSIQDLKLKEPPREQLNLNLFTAEELKTILRVKRKYPSVNEKPVLSSAEKKELTKIMKNYLKRRNQNSWKTK